VSQTEMEPRSVPMRTRCCVWSQSLVAVSWGSVPSRLVSSPRQAAHRDAAPWDVLGVCRARVTSASGRDDLV